MGLCNQRISDKESSAAGAEVNAQIIVAVCRPARAGCKQAQAAAVEEP
jgi:hypothetical protein